MGDLLKTMRSSQLFSVSGLPDVAIRKVEPEEKGGPQRYEVELLGLDTFDPTTFEAQHRDGDDVPAWFLDTAWNGLSFHVSQAFFPRTSAWDNLKKALKTDFEESVWDHLSGTVSAPFTAGDVARDRGEGDRRPRQRAARRQVARRGGMSAVRGRAADPQLAVRGAGRALADRGGAARRSARRAGGEPATSTATRRRRSPRPAQPARGEWQELELVNLIRERLAQWREAGYPGATRTTLDLIRHWRRDGREQRLFFAQLEAAETIIFLTRRAPTSSRASTCRPRSCPRASTPFTRYACKMATGSGKTTVMGMLAAWSILNKVAARGDARFSDVVLVVCPNVTIRERLAELDPNRGDASIYRTRDLVPRAPDAVAAARARARQELARVRAQGDERGREGAEERRAGDGHGDDQDRRRRRPRAAAAAT